MLGTQTQQPFYQSAHNDCSHQRSHALGGGNGNGEGQKGEADTHHHGQAGTYAPERIQLHQGADTCYDHTVLHKCSRRLNVQSHHIGQDDDGCYIAHKHGQDMLQPKGNGLPYRYSAIQGIEITHGRKD